jgi:hypothetical protein
LALIVATEPTETFHRSRASLFSNRAFTPAPSVCRMDDTDLEAALAASAAEAAAQHNTSLRMDQTLPPLRRTAGFCAQHNLLDQFHATWQPAISRHQTASAICGYLTIAHVRLLRSLLAGAPQNRPLTAADIARLGQQLMATPEQRVLCEVERAMASILRKRTAYVAAHPADFDATTELQYLRAWVANYELSDELRDSLDAEVAVASLFAADGGSGAPPPAYFSRFNEWVSIADATHEERARIAAEQSRFGGTLDAKGVAQFGDGDAAVILECFGPKRAAAPELLTPTEWSAAESALGRLAGTPRIWAVDTSGHFYAAVSCRVEPRPYGEPEDVLLVLNSTSANYLRWPMAGLLHGFIFGSKGESGDVAGGPPIGAIAELASMGFDEPAVRAALAQTGGSVSAAVEVLVSGAKSP